MAPKTSIIIPCYNGEEFLGEALESVRLQTVPVREIVVVDDGSDVPIRAPFGWNGPPLKILRTPNRGLAAARNLGLANVTGEFVAFLDADDLWHPCKIEAQEQALRSNQSAVACYTRCVDAPGFFGFGPYPPLDVSDDEFLLVLWYQAFFPPSAVMVRHDVLKAVGSFQDEMGIGAEDVELWFRLLNRGRFIQVDEPLCFYRQHPNQFTNNLIRKWLGAKRAFSEMIAQHADRLTQAGLRRDKLWDAYRKHILLVYYRRRFDAARCLLWDYWKDHPRDAAIFIRALISLLPARLVGWLRGRLPEREERKDEAPPNENSPSPGWTLAWQRVQRVLAQ